MNDYFIDLLEKIKTGQMSNDIFSPDKCYWESARSWASRYSNNDSISDECVLDLLLEHLWNGYNLLSLGKEYLGCPIILP